jgi:hypothetical protein
VLGAQVLATDASNLQSLNEVLCMFWTFDASCDLVPFPH